MEYPGSSISGLQPSKEGQAHLNAQRDSRTGNSSKLKG
jgi:hypothetical protein